jgi:hypothetical protein
MVSKDKLANNRSPNWAFMEKFIVPHYDDPVDYLVRWRIIQTPLFGVYLHKLGTSDPRDTLHNHPWPFISFVLRGGYLEAVQSEVPGAYCRWRHVKRINIKRLRDWHWIHCLYRVPTWTLMFVGRRQRVWQYMDRDGTLTDYDKHRFNDEFLASIERKARRVAAEQSRK